MNRYLKLVAFAWMLIYGMQVVAQDGYYITVRDLESWSAFNLKYKLSKKWSLSLEEQLRFNNNSSTLDAFFTELNVDYDFNKHFFGGVGVRIIRQYDDVGKIQGFENHMRYDFNFGYKHAIKRFDLKYRLRFQTKNELGITAEEGDYANNHLRFKVGSSYDFKGWKLDPFLSTEIFRHFERGETNGFDKYRFTVGTEYKTKSIGTFGAFYRMERELNVVYPKTTNIIGFKYTYTLKTKKK